VSKGPEHKQTAFEMFQDGPASHYKASGETERASGGKNVSRIPLPKCLPDVDDASMSHVFQYIDHYEQDLFWSFLSDSFFIAGGIGYVILSLLDAISPSGTEARRCYSSVELLAPVVYLVNSVIDVEWATRVRQREKVKQAMTGSWKQWRALQTEEAAALEHSRDHGRPWYTRLRKHAAHRRTIMAALTFGIAAVSAVLAVVCSSSDFLSKWSDLISVHVYILSAVIAVTGKRTRPWLMSSSASMLKLNNPELLEDLGDIFFLFGSLVDGMLCDLHFDDANPFWPTLSSLLWLLDACFYLRSDFIMAGRVQGIEFEGGALV
jgi:hypothetical protein